MNSKSVKSSNPLKSPEYLGTGVIKTFMVKANGGELKVTTKDNVGSTFMIYLTL